VILATCTVALLVTGGALFAFQVFHFRQNFTRSLAALGEIIAKNSTAAVAFKDKQATHEMLEALRAKPYIQHARIWLTDGSTLAEYGQMPPAAVRSGLGTKAGLQTEGDYLVYRRAIVLDGEQIGMLVLRCNYEKELNNLKQLYLLTLLVVLSFSILLAFLLSAPLQRVISEPILSLARTAKIVAEKRDFSVRASKLEEDEIGLFTDAFNQMLQQIQEQAAALRAAHQQKFESLVNSIDGIVWEADPATLQFTFVSEQAQRLVGYPPSRWTESTGFLEDCLHRRTADRRWKRRGRASTPSSLSPLNFAFKSAEGRDVWVP
jgi:PAS domain-containing protein